MSGLKWLVPVAFLLVIGGVLLGARSNNGREPQTGKYPAPDVSIVAQRLILPWERALTNPEVRQTLDAADPHGAREKGPKPKRYKRKRKADLTEAPASMDAEMGMMAADDPSLTRPEHHEPEATPPPPEWKEWAEDSGRG